MNVKTPNGEFIDGELFDQLPDGTILISDNGDVVIKLKPNDTYHTWHMVCHTVYGTLHHMSEFTGLSTLPNLDE